MIQLFEIKKKVKQMKNTDKELLEKYTETSKKSKEEILKQYNTKEEGLTQKEYEKRYEKNGPNIVVKNEKKSWLEFFIKSFNDKFIYILFLLAIIDFVLADKLGAGIILGIAVVSAFIKFCQNYSTYKFNQKLKAQIYSSTNVVRNGKEKEVKVENIAIGDIIKLNAGSIIPADIILIESKDLFLNQSVFTGESVLVEKATTPNEPKGIFDINNICLMGSSVVSGSGTAVVIQTGFDTYLGRMSKEIDNKKEITNFEKGMNNITKLLIKYMIVVSIAVFVIYAFIRHNMMEALLFALSVAVGITPSMLPMIVNVNLTKGSKTLAKKKTLVKNIQSIQNLGAIDILCTDKTGTLTQDKITLQKYINVMGEEDLDILKYAYLNSYYGTGIKNLVDKAVIAYGNQHKIKQVLKEYEKVDEIPFDYTRKRMSVVVKSEDGYRMLTKGAIEEILKCCKEVKYKDEIIPITEDLVKQITVTIKYNSRKGKEETVTGERLKTKETIYKDSLEIIPNLYEGMIPISSETQATNKYATNWFDYSKEKVAKIMLQDGNYDTDTGKITNEGSSFVYVPRFAYKINSDESVDIKFLNTDNTCKDGSSTQINNESDNIENDKYYLPSCFSQNNIQVAGIWIGEYLSKQNTEGNNGEQVYIGEKNEANNYKYWTNLTDEEKQEKCNYLISNGANYGLKGDETAKVADTSINNMLDILKKSNYKFIAEEIKEKSITVKIQAGVEGRVFGSISSKEIALEAKKQLNMDIDKKKIIIPDAIKSLGTYNVNIKLHKDVVGKLAVKVEAK